MAILGIPRNLNDKIEDCLLKNLFSDAVKNLTIEVELILISLSRGNLKLEFDDRQVQK